MRFCYLDIRGKIGRERAYWRRRIVLYRGWRELPHGKGVVKGGTHIAVAAQPHSIEDRGIGKFGIFL